MEAKYGRAVVDELEELAGTYKWSRDELHELKQYYKDKIDGLTRRRSVFSEPDMGIQVLDMFEDISEAEDVPQKTNKS